MVPPISTIRVLRTESRWVRRKFAWPNEVTAGRKTLNFLYQTAYADTSRKGSVVGGAPFAKPGQSVLTHIVPNILISLINWCEWKNASHRMDGIQTFRFFRLMTKESQAASHRAWCSMRLRRNIHGSWAVPQILHPQPRLASPLKAPEIWKQKLQAAAICISGYVSMR